VTAESVPATEAPDESQAGSETALRGQLPALEARVEASPQDGEAWALLARTRSSLGEYGAAVPAYAEASRLLPESAPVWSGYAEALAITRGHMLDGEPYQMALKAVELDMNDQKGLELLGIYHFQSGNYGQAAFYWRRLARLLPPESPFAQDIAGAAAEATARARAMLDAPPGDPTPPAP
jgi:cytochrome c-type biogenesis protein CcmH